MTAMSLAAAINEYVEARCKQAVIEATAPNDRPRMERAKEATAVANGKLMHTIAEYDMSVQQTIWANVMPEFQMIGHILTALDAMAGDNKPAQDAINAARAVVSKEQAQ